MVDIRIELRPADREELSDILLPNIQSGGIMLPGVVRNPKDAMQPCTIVIIHPIEGPPLNLEAQIVHIGTNQTAVQLSHFNEHLVERIRSFIGEEDVSQVRTNDCDDDADLLGGDDADSYESIQQQIRALPVGDRQRVARTGSFNERVALERAFGKDVWDPLLRNPSITIPEVARIARMGSLPMPLLEIILANRSWISSAVIRRALLSHPRLSGQGLNKVLAATPKSELKLIPNQTAYPMAVRAAAQKLLKQTK